MTPGRGAGLGSCPLKGLMAAGGCACRSTTHKVVGTCKLYCQTCQQVALDNSDCVGSDQAVLQ